MNVNQIINLVIRVVMRKAISAGVDKGVGAFSNMRQARKRREEKQGDRGYHDDGAMDAYQKPQRSAAQPTLVDPQRAQLVQPEKTKISPEQRQKQREIRQARREARAAK